MNRREVLALPLVAAFAGAAAPKRPEVRVLAGGAVQGPVEAIAAAFPGATVTCEFFPSAQVDAKLKAGATPDIVITQADRAPAIEPDARKRIAVGTMRLGVAALPSAVRPDLSSVESFAASMQRAGSIGYIDPARGSATGVHFHKVFTALKFNGAPPSVVLGEGGADLLQRVLRGEVALGVGQISEIIHANRGLLAGPLPDAIQLETTYVAMLRAPQSAAAKAFLASLRSTAGAAEFKKAGFS